MQAFTYVRTRCNVNWNYICVVTRENAWSWESQPGVMYALCRGSRQGRAVLSLAKWSSSASGYTTPRAILLRATYVDAIADRLYADSFSPSWEIQRGIEFPRAYAWRLKESPYLQSAFSRKRGRPIITKFRLSDMKILVDVKRGPRIIWPR